MTAPQLRNEGGQILAALPVGVARIVPSHNDRRRARWWRAVIEVEEPAGVHRRVLFPWSPTPLLAALRAADLCRR